MFGQARVAKMVNYKNIQAARKNKGREFWDPRIFDGGFQKSDTPFDEFFRMGGWAGSDFRISAPYFFPPLIFPPLIFPSGL